MLEKDGKKYVELDKNAYAISVMKPVDLYDALCKELSFNKMVELYKLIKHKMEFLTDEPRNELSSIDLSLYED